MADGSQHQDAAAALPWLTAVAATIGGVLGAFGLWLANRTLGKAAFQTAMNDGFSKLLDQLQEEREIIRKEFAAYRIISDAERAQLRGEVINLTQAFNGLKNLLRRKGIEIPKEYEMPASFTVIENKRPGVER